jgi:hypothetical protein
MKKPLEMEHLSWRELYEGYGRDGSFTGDSEGYAK